MKDFGFLVESEQGTASKLALYEMLKTGQGFEEGSEVEKLYLRNQKDGVVNFRVTLNPDWTGTAEELAKELNRQAEFMDEPVNRLLARIGGKMFLLEDSIRCAEKKVKVTPDGFEKVTLTLYDEYRIKEKKEMLDILEQASDMLDELNKKLKNAGMV